MTVTRILYFLPLCFVICVVVQALQPDGYLGCFKDYDGNSLGDGDKIYNSVINTGEFCKARCREHNKRYAGTQEQNCYCGNRVFEKRNTSSTECNRSCPNSVSEICGGFVYGEWRISIYDTRPLPSDQSVSTITTTVNFTISPSRQATRSSTLPSNQTVSAIKATVHLIISPSIQNTESLTLPNQTSVNLSAVYIAIPVTIIVMAIAMGLIICIILKKKRNQTKENATKQSSANTGHLTEYNVCNERDKIWENSANVIHIGRKKGNVTIDRDIIPMENSANVTHSGSRIDNATIDESDNNYNTIAQWRELNMHKDISADANEYGHLNVRPTAFHDPTYSHTTGLQNSNDYTYSHMNQSAAKLSHVDHDTYSTCQMTGETGKHRPAMKNEDIDDTYNTLGINGKALNMPEERNNVKDLNEPDYDHTNVNYH